MISKRMRLAKLLNDTGATSMILWFRSRLPSPWLTALNFHRVAEPQAESDFDSALIDATPEEFDRHMATVKRYFNVVDMDALRRLVEGKRLPPNPAIVTFDDGYRDNHDVALPILVRHGVPATFFLSTYYITERKMFWWDRIAYQLKRCQKDKIQTTYPSRQEFDLKNGRPGAIRSLVQLVIREYGLDLERFLRELTVATAVEWDEAIEREFADKHIMTWDQVRALHKAGMDIQSHTHTHRVLQTLDARQLDRELTGSRSSIEREVGEAPFAISYPVSRSILGQPALCEAVRKAGYVIGFSGASGVTPLWSGHHPLDFRRVALDRGMSDAYFRSILAIPSLAYSPLKRGNPTA